MNEYEFNGIPFSKICRTCLKINDQMKSIFDGGIPDMIMSAINIQVAQNDGSPGLICVQCLNQVTNSYSFKQLCLQSEEILKQYTLVGYIPDNGNKFTNPTDIELPLKFDAKQLYEAEIIFTTLPEDKLIDRNEDYVIQLMQNSDDEDTQGYLDCEDVGLEPECNLVENAIAALKQDLHINDNTENVVQTLWAEGSIIADEPQNLKPDIAGKESKYNFISDAENQVICELCGTLYPSENDLTPHMSLHRTDGVIQCNLCEKQFARMAILKRHIKTHMSDKPHRCEFCMKTFTEKCQLTRHVKRHQSTREKRYECNSCNKKYRDAYDLTIHIRTHTGVKPYSCKQCSAKFTTSRLLASHMRTHKQERSFPCRLCTKSFIHSSNLASHMKIHTGERPYVCHVCDKSFLQSSNLKLHMRSHDGSRPYSCQVCNKRFASSSANKQHQRIHTGEKPFQCIMCEKAFARSDDLTLHVRSHTGEKPYTCNICNKKFSTSSHRKKHKETHINGKHKLFECPECATEFTKAVLLKRHINTHKTQSTRSIKKQIKRTPTVANTI